MALTATQTKLLRRLRRLADPGGHGYSVSAPGFSSNISTLTAPNIRFAVDGGSQIQVSMGNPAALKTAQAICLAIENAVKAADPALPGATTEGYESFTCTFDVREGYTLRSGSRGTGSAIHIYPATSGDDVSAPLCLGSAQGGHETQERGQFSDAELLELLDDGLANQIVYNLTPVNWTWATLPPKYETIVTYRGWTSALDAALGRAAYFFPQKIEAEETSPNKIFDQLMALRKRVTDMIDDLNNALNDNIVVGTLTRWDYQTQEVISEDVYDNQDNQIFLVSAIPGPTAGTVLVEFQEIETDDSKALYFGYRPSSSGVLDPSLYNDPTYTDLNHGFESPSVFFRKLTNTKNTLLKVTGLTTGQTVYFAAQLVDQNGNRYFSNEVSAVVP